MTEALKLTGLVPLTDCVYEDIGTTYFNIIILNCLVSDTFIKYLRQMDDKVLVSNDFVNRSIGVS